MPPAIDPPLTTLKINLLNSTKKKKIDLYSNKNKKERYSNKNPSISLYDEQWLVLINRALICQKQNMKMVNEICHNKIEEQ